MIENGFKFLRSGGFKAEDSVGVIVANWLVGKVVGVERFNDRMIKVRIVIGDVVWELAPCYWWVVTLMTVLVVIWVVLERFLRFLGLDK